MVRRGDVFYADLGPAKEKGIQSGQRPVLIISNNQCNEHSPVIHVIPFTHQFRKFRIPTQTIITSVTKSLALGEQMQLIPKHKLQNKLGHLSKPEMLEIEKCVKVQLDLI